MLANRKRQRTPRNGMKCEVARNMGIGKEEKLADKYITDRLPSEANRRSILYPKLL